MPRPKSVPDPYLLGKVSTLYYLREHTQQSIADRLSLSRPTVSRLLREARELGFVQITVSAPRGLHLELESRLEDRFRLRSVQVVDVEPGLSPALLHRQLGAAAAKFLARTIRPGETIGMAWGSTLSAMVQCMSPLPTDGVRVVQVLGGIGRPDAAENAGALVRQLAKLLDASAVLLPAPGVVATPAVRDVLSQDPHVRAALTQLDLLDSVFVGVGSLSSNAVLNDGQTMSVEASQSLRDGGAVGDIALRFLDSGGRPVLTALDDRILGITTAQLRRAPRVVAVAGGAGKIDAIAAALASGIIHVMITDRSTAESLLAQELVSARTPTETYR